MQTLKEDAIQVISSIPEPVDIDDVMIAFMFWIKSEKAGKRLKKGTL